MTALLTLDEAAERLRVSRRTVERLVRDGKLRVLRPAPRRVVIDEREVEAFIAALRRVA